MIDPNTLPADWQPLDDEARKNVVLLTNCGVPRTVAAGYVRRTVDDIRHMELIDEKFRDEMTHAESSNVFTALRTIAKAADNNKSHWRAAAWLLERCYPERFGRRGAKTVTPTQMEELINIVRDVVNTHVPDPEVRSTIHDVFATRVKAVLNPDEGEADAT